MRGERGFEVLPAQLPPCGPSPPVTVSVVNTINDPSHVRAHSREGALGDPGSVLLARLSYLISIVGGIGAGEDGGKRGEGSACCRTKAR